MATVTVATASPSLIDLARDFYQGEIKDHDTYNALAERERNPELRAVLRRIAGIELKHSTFWHAVLERRNAAVPQARTGRARLAVLRTLQRFVSSAFLVSALEAGESGAFAKYLECLRHADLSEPERDQLRVIVLDEIEHEMTFRRESSKLGLSNVRDYVLGMNDGLVEILGVVTGLSAVYVGNPLVVGISGVVVGVAGAMSMGIGAFVSVRSQRQVNEALRERVEILFQVAPYFVAGSSLTALIGSVALAGVALALTATTVSVLSGIRLRTKVTEMIVAAFSAAAIAYVFGLALRIATGISV